MFLANPEVNHPKPTHDPTILDRMVSDHGHLRQDLSVQELTTLLEPTRSPWLPSWLSDQLSSLILENFLSPKAELITNNPDHCQLIVYEIPGAAKPNDLIDRAPVNLPCNYALDEHGNATITFESPDFSAHVNPGQNAVLVVPVPALTQKDGSIPILVLAHIATNETDAAAILCPDGLLSNLLLGNSPEGNGFATSPESSTACYNAMWDSVPVYAYSANDSTPHPVTLNTPRNGNVFIFSDTQRSPYGSWEINLGDTTHNSWFIQGALMTGLKDRLGENTVVLFAPQGVNIDTTRLPEYTPPTITPTPTPIETPTATITAPTLIETTETITDLIPPRPILGTKLSAEINCSTDACFEIYGLVDPNLPEFQDLMQQYASGAITTTYSGNLVNQIIEHTNDHKLKNWWNKLWGKPEIPPPVRRLDVSYFKMEEIIFAFQSNTGFPSQSPSIFITRNKALDGTTLYFIVRGKNALLSETTMTLTDQINNVDLIGTQVMQNIQAEVPKYPGVSHQTDWSSDLFVTEPHLVSGTLTGQAIKFLTEAYPDSNIPGFLSTSTGLVETLIPVGTTGKYNGLLYVEPTTGKLYIGITTTDEAGVIISDAFVPADSVDTDDQ